MKFKKWLSGIYYSIKKNDTKLKSSSLCGIPLITYSETIRATPDQDDAWFFYLAKHHKVIFDIGANIGYTALLAMIQDPDRDYVLVDPNPLALQKAQGNLLNNNFGFKARYYSAFVSDKLNEMVKFYTIGAGAAGSMYSSHAESAAAVNSFKNVTTVTLDYLYSYYGLRPDLVKIDVEGEELAVLRGGVGTLARTRFVIIEISLARDNDLSEQAVFKIFSLLQQAGFGLYGLVDIYPLSPPQPNLGIAQFDAIFRNTRLSDT